MPVNPEEFAQLSETFNYNDKDKDGSIEFDEFVTMLRDLDADVGDDEAKIGFRAIDTNRDGVIELDEFVAWWSER